jgi:FAD/FMN-containing dehydrogenase
MRRRALYAPDDFNYRQVAIGPVIPRTIDDVIATVSVCREFGAAVLSRGGGTTLAGQCCNAALVLDSRSFSRTSTGWIQRSAWRMWSLALCSTRCDLRKGE